MSSNAVDTGDIRTERSSWLLLRLLVFVSVYAVLRAVVDAATLQKLQFLFKNEMHLRATAVGTVLLITSVPAVLQPLLGLVTDIQPIFGYFRRPYFVLSALVAALGYYILGGLSGFGLGSVVVALTIASAGAVFATLIVNVVIIESCWPKSYIGVLQGITVLVPMVLDLRITNELAALSNSEWTYTQSFHTASICYLIMIGAWFFIPDRVRLGASVGVRRRFSSEVGAAVQNATVTPRIWLVGLFLFCMILTPGLQNTQVRFQQDVLKLSEREIGILRMWTAGGGILGILVFSSSVRRWSTRSLVWLAYILGCIYYPIMMMMAEPSMAPVALFMAAINNNIYLLSLMLLGARLCPPWFEGTVYGVVLALIAIASPLSEQIGGLLYDLNGGDSASGGTAAWIWTLVCGMGLTATVVVLIPYLPVSASDSASTADT